jgi:hypothetical protein
VEKICWNQLLLAVSYTLVAKLTANGHTDSSFTRYTESPSTISVHDETTNTLLIAGSWTTGNFDIVIGTVSSNIRCIRSGRLLIKGKGVGISTLGVLNTTISLLLSDTHVIPRKEAS